MKIDNWNFNFWINFVVILNRVIDRVKAELQYVVLNVFRNTIRFTCPAGQFQEEEEPLSTDFQFQLVYWKAAGKYFKACCVAEREDP